jgi:CheY-like chemotaxis protein
MTSDRTILLFEPDDDTRPFLVGNLQDQGFTIIVAIDQADVVQRAIHHDSIDLILLNQANLSLDESVDLAGRIRHHINVNRPIPAVIIAERFSEELEGHNVKINDLDIVTYLTDGQQLFDLLQELSRHE